MGALTPPLQLKQAIVISDVDGLKSLYDLLAQEIRCLPPSIEFEVMAGDVRAFEEEYRVSASRQEESERLLFTGDGTTSQTIKNPEVLCISSRQLEETARADFELIRRALPMNLYHDVVVTSEELSTQLATRHYDIIHAALYICPFTGDLVFDEIDLETKASKVQVPDRMTAEDFAKLVDVAATSLLVVTTPNLSVL